MNRVSRWMGVVALCSLVLAGCTVKEADKGGEGTSSSGSDGKLAGIVAINGSSTVFPISQAVAEEFQKQHAEVRVEVGTSGTGGGFKKFIHGETDINDASRPIKQSEIDACKESGIEYLELKIAIDGLSVMVNPQNDWCDGMTVAQLKMIWEPGSEVQKWSDVDPSWPDEEFQLYGPDTDSGTFDYFTEVICGESQRSRTDYEPSTNDNVLVQGIAGDKYSLGYFGYAYYAENTDKLKVIGVSPDDDISNCVIPNDETIEAGEYTPLSRPLFLYVNKASLKKPQVVEFLKYYLKQGQDLVSEVGYVRLSSDILSETEKALEESL